MWLVSRAGSRRKPRHDVDPDRELAHERMISVCSCDSFEKATIPRRLQLLERARQLVGVPRMTVVEVVATYLRLVVDEAEQVDVVLRVVEELAPEQLTDLYCADDLRCR